MADPATVESVVHVALPDALIEPTAARARAAGLPIALARWSDDPGADAVLLLAPHELPPPTLQRVLRAAPWAWVHLTSAGLDFVDLDRWAPDTLLTRTWHGYAAPLAEYALGAILTHEWRRGAPWDGAGEAGGLWEARVGVAGWGAVGRRIAEVAAALGARVRVLSRTPRSAHARIEHTTDVATLLDADHLVIALPLTSDTHGLFSASLLRRARRGMHLVNISRAAIVDQAALAELCAEGQLSATLDVSDPEPLPGDHPLRQLPSVRLSPHVAWRSRASQYAFVEDFATAWRALEGGTEHVPGCVDGTATARARAAVARVTAAPERAA